LGAIQMLSDKNRYKLLHKYRAPNYQWGQRVYCYSRKRVVEVGRYSDGPIYWPCVKKTGRKSLILCDDLVKAVKVESEIAVAHWWGVSVNTVWKWRKALGVGQITTGTNRLYKEYKPEKLTDEITEKGREKARSPESRQKIGDSKRGKPAHPNTLKNLKMGINRKYTDEERKRLSDRMKNEWKEGRRHNPDEWTAEENKILIQNVDKTDAEIAELLSDRSKMAVRGQRHRLGYKRQTAPERSDEEIAILNYYPEMPSTHFGDLLPNRTPAAIQYQRAKQRKKQ